MILLVDNYDSFSFNLYQYVGSINPNIKVIKNDEMTVDEIIKLNPSHIILSPGPGRPENAGIIEDIVRKIHNIPILGVCLGHQAICDVFGLNIINAKRICHGKKDNVKVDNNSTLFKGLNGEIQAARYHSLIGSGKTEELRITAYNSDNEIMAVEHKKYPIYGIQFHPESILTKDGMQILKNFLR
jgi:anthranilate synthase component 2